MKLDNDTVWAILNATAEPGVAGRIIHRLKAEEDFRDRYTSLRMDREDLRRDRPFVSDNAVMACDNQIIELLKRCEHWVRYPDGTCRVCGEPV